MIDTTTHTLKLTPLGNEKDPPPWAVLTFAQPEPDQRMLMYLLNQVRKKNHQMANSIGTMNGNVYLVTYATNVGVRTLF